VVNRIKPKKVQSSTQKLTDFETLFAQAPQRNPSPTVIKGVVCVAIARVLGSSKYPQAPGHRRLYNETLIGETINAAARKVEITCQY
jgi:hypothetical protein